MALGLTAVPATPARAATTSSASYGGPYTITYPGGDMVFSVTDDGESSSIIQDAIQNKWPQAVGLASGASLSDLFQATWRLASSYGSSLPDPPTFSGGSLSVSGSTITVDIPAANVSGEVNTAAWPGWAAAIVSTLLGGLAFLLAWGLCAVAFLGLSPAAGVVLAGWGLRLCNGAGVFMWIFVSTIAYDGLTETPFTSGEWARIVAASIGGFLVGFGISWASPTVGRQIPAALGKLWGGVKSGASTAWNILKSIGSWLGTQFTNFANWLSKLLGRTATDAPIQMNPVNQQAGQATQAGAGTVTASGGNCMDAYGSNDGAYPGQEVAINACNGNPAQSWADWSNSEVSVWGQCLDTRGGTSSFGYPLVDLEPCNGGASQAWTQKTNGPTLSLVNQATGDCLDDPGGNTSPGTHLQIYPCNGSGAQTWYLPSPRGGVCDIYAFYGSPCVAAYSTTRALYAGYGGWLYEVQRASDGALGSIGVVGPGGVVNATQQDTFCSGTSCIIVLLYDQSPEGNNMPIAANDHGANATALPIKIGGSEAYGVDVEPGVGYRNNDSWGAAYQGSPEGMYMVASGTHVNSGCCFDFGNVEVNSKDNGAGHMDAVNLTTFCMLAPCSGSGPWVQADLENGQYMGSGSNPNNLGNSTPFVTALLKNNGQNTFALKGADSTTGGLSTWYNGALPSGYAPMHQEGGIEMGTGGDNTANDVGSWFEGVMTAGWPSDAADNAVQANIVAAGYSGSTNPSGGGGGGGGFGGPPPSGSGLNNDWTPSAAGQAVVHSAGGTGCGAYGYSSVYTVDLSNAHLEESYLPCMFQDWGHHDMSAEFGTPPVMSGTQPVSLVHCGWTSVYTVDAGSGDLQETYLSAIGQWWGTQDLSQKYGTPPTNVTPTAVEHTAGAPGSSPGCGFTSVYTVDGNGDLQETYLSNSGFPGDPWTTQDLSRNYGAAQVRARTSPVAIVHCLWTSVYYVDSAGGLEEAYLSSIGAPWGHQSLSVNYGTPAVAANTSPTAVVHFAGDNAGTCGWTSVYTVDAGSNHLEESYLPDEGFPGDAWHIQDLSNNYGAGTAILNGTSPVALVHMGWTSVYFVNAASGLEEFYLSAIYQNWGYQSLSVNYGSPPTHQTPIELVHPDASGNLDWTSVYTIRADNSDLEETYLSNVGFPGDPWQTQDLSARFGTPPAT